MADFFERFGGSAGLGRGQKGVRKRKSHRENEGRKHAGEPRSGGPEKFSAGGTGTLGYRPENGPRMRRLIALAFAVLILAGCREVRVKTYAQGSTAVIGPPQILIIRNARDLSD